MSEMDGPPSPSGNEPDLRIYRLGLVARALSVIIIVTGVIFLILQYSTRNIRAVAEKSTNDSFLISDTYFLTSIDETISIAAESLGDTDIELAIGRANDIYAFAQNFSYGVITDFADAAKLNVKNENYSQVNEDAAEITYAEIRQLFIDSDMWLARDAQTSPAVEYNPGMLPGQNLVVAALAPPGQPLKLTVTFTRTISLQIIGLFVFPAVLLAGLSIILLSIFRYQKGEIIIRKVSPFRSRSERKDERKVPPQSHLVVLLAIVFAASSTLTGCSSVPKIESAPTTSQELVFPNLTSTQIQTIVDQTVSILNTAHELNSSKILEQRVTGPALTLRKSQLKINIGLKTVEDVSIIPTQLRMVVSDNQTTWPRRIMVITEPTENLGAEKLLTFIQDTPTALYKLWSITRIFPNLMLPVLETESTGASPIDNKTLDLRNKPLEVLAQYADVLQKDATSTFFNDFVEDPLQEQIRQIISDSNTQDDNDSQELTFRVSDDEIIGFRTVDGGALFFGRIDSDWVRDAGAGRLAVDANKEEEVLLGTQEVKQKITVTYEQIVGIYIPPAGFTHKIQVVSAERYPISVKTG
jgi:hypothetical protein